MLKKTKLLIGAYYIDNPKFAQIDEIFKYISDEGEPITNELDEIQKQFLNSQIAEFKESYSFLEKNRPNLLKINNEELSKVFINMIDKFYEEFNLKNCDKPKVSIVKKFPHPFENANYKAMNFNEHQAEKFNVEKGIYLLEKYTAHGISEIMLAHELMHFVVGEMTKKNNQISQSPFFEEGIVDFMGLYLLLKYNFIDEKCIKNWLIFGRGNCTENYIGSIYFRESKQILWIAKTSGIEEVIKIIKSGQNGLSNLSMKNYCDKKVEPTKDEFLNKLISYYDYALTNFSISAKENYVFKNTLNLVNGKNLDELLLNELEKEEIEQVINNLTKKGLMYIVDKKVYNPNNCSIDTMKIKLI